MEAPRYIAIDVGAESGRVIQASVGKDSMRFEHLWRFEHQPWYDEGVLKWDFYNIRRQIGEGISKLLDDVNAQPSGIGVDCWNVDFGLLDEAGELKAAPVHYRDRRTEGMMEAASEIMSKPELFEITGQQFLQQNTLYQLLALRKNQAALLSSAHKLLFMAGLIENYLCGNEAVEWSTASTSQLADVSSGQWSDEIFERFDFPRAPMPAIVAAGAKAGSLRDSAARELRRFDIPVYTVGSHDTASAVAGIGAHGDRWGYLSSGTWSLAGVETAEPIVTQESFAGGFGNEGGVFGRTRFLKNVMGLWLVQQCRKQWAAEGEMFSYDDMMSMAAEAQGFVAYLDVDCPRFFWTGDMPAAIRSYLEETEQNCRMSKGQMIRLILEGLAFKYRQVFEAIEEVTGQAVEVIHVVGGGAKNQLLCQFTANATGKVVAAGPDEATAAGNVIVQAIAAGQLATLEEGRRIIANSFPTVRYEEEDAELWDKHYQRYLHVRSQQVIDN